MNKYGKLRKPIVYYTISVIIIVLHTNLRLLAFIVWEIFDDFFYNGTFMERKKNERTNKPRKPMVTYTIKVIIIALHTKFEASSFLSSWEIFDKEFNIGLYGEKVEWKNNWTNNPRKSIVSYTI